MTDIYVCREAIFDDMHPCFTDENGDCNAITIEECGLDLKGIPENEQTRELFNAARKTGLSTILSFEDAIEVAKDHFDPVIAQNCERTYQNNLRQEAAHFLATSQLMIQQMLMRKPVEKPIDCSGVPFGTNAHCDMLNFGRTLFDVDSYGHLLSDAQGRRKGDFDYLQP